MIKIRNIVHPNFVLGLLSQILFFAGGMYITNNHDWGIPLAIVALGMAFIHWIWGMIDAWTDRDLKNKDADNYFWFSLILLIPPLAGLMYYMIHDKRIRF